MTFSLLYNADSILNGLTGPGEEENLSGKK